MPDLHLSQINQKFQLLLKEILSLRQENRKLEKSMQEGNEKITRQQEEIATLEEKMKLLKMVTSSDKDTEKDLHIRKEIRTTLNSYIREIDNCIALLNK